MGMQQAQLVAIGILVASVLAAVYLLTRRSAASKPV
jgi:hypothetical protein